MRRGVKRGVRVRCKSFRAEGANLFSQGPAVNVLGFAVSLQHVLNSAWWLAVLKQHRQYCTEMNRCGSVAITLCLQKQAVGRIWPPKFADS